MNNPCRFSPDRKYRYTLQHRWDNLFEKKTCMWIGLNPSTADENQLDPTLRRIKGFSSLWGYNCFYMTNLFAFRATLPKNMKAEKDPIGKENDHWILECATECQLILAAWGGHGEYLNRATHVTNLLKKAGHSLHCVGTNSNPNIPSHPLYIPYKKNPIPFLPH